MKLSSNSHQIDWTLHTTKTANEFGTRLNATVIKLAGVSNSFINNSSFNYPSVLNLNHNGAFQVLVTADLHHRLFKTLL